jgi:hypothetical protein
LVFQGVAVSDGLGVLFSSDVVEVDAVMQVVQEVLWYTFGTGVPA